MAAVVVVSVVNSMLFWSYISISQSWIVWMNFESERASECEWVHWCICMYILNGDAFCSYSPIFLPSAELILAVRDNKQQQQ